MNHWTREIYDIRNKGYMAKSYRELLQKYIKVHEMISNTEKRSYEGR